MNRRRTSPPRSQQPGRAGSFAPLLLLVLLACEALLVSTYPDQSRRGAPAFDASQSAYFRSGQWLADVRTLSAAARYLFESDASLPQALSSTGMNLSLPRAPLSQWEAAPDRPVHPS